MVTGLVTLGAGDFNVLLEHGKLLIKEPSGQLEALREAIGAGRCRCVGEFFSEAFRSRRRSRNSHDAGRRQRLSRCRGLLRLFE